MDFKTNAASLRLESQCANSKYDWNNRSKEAAKRTETNMINHIDKLYTRNYNMQNVEWQSHKQAECLIDIGDKFCKIVHLLSWHRKKHLQQQQQLQQHQHHQVSSSTPTTATTLEYTNRLDHHRESLQILSCTESPSICTPSNRSNKNNSSYNRILTQNQLSFKSSLEINQSTTLSCAALHNHAPSASTSCCINLRNALDALPYSTSIFLYINCIIRNLFYINKLNLKLLHLLLLVLLIVAFLPVKTNCIMLKKTAHARSDLRNSKDLINSNNNNTTKDSRHSGYSSNGLSKRLSPFVMKSDELSPLAAASYNVSKAQKTPGFGAAGGSSSYLDNFENLERSLAAVLIKVAYGTTSTTKRSIPNNTYMPRLTTIPTPLLTTFRYQDKLSAQSRDNAHHRSYELDLEKDHALPTSAPNADILKSNSNTFYPNPNRHYNNKDRSRFRHIENSTTQPTLPNLLKKKGVLTPTVSVFPSYGSPPTRSFFTPPLPPEYQHPFADKPTLRGTNNDGITIANTGIYVNRRPIPPPSLMPGHERIPFRPPDLGAGDGRNATNDIRTDNGAAIGSVNDNADNGHSINTLPMSKQNDNSRNMGSSRRNPLYDEYNSDANKNFSSSSPEIFDGGSKTAYNVNNKDLKKDAFPSIRRILSGSNGRRGEIPEVLLKQVTSRPSYKHASSSEVFIDTTSAQNASNVASNDRTAAEQASGVYSSNINEFKNVASEEDFYGGGSAGGNVGMDAAAKNKDQHRLQNVKLTSKMAAAETPGKSITSTPSAAAAIGGDIITASVATTLKASPSNLSSSYNKNNGAGSGTSKSSTLSTTYISWTVAWNVHIYLSVILFTILTVYSAYKIITYNKLSHLFPQSYFICIHLVLTLICLARIFYLCYDAYNIHSSFNLFVSDILLNLPATFLTIAFSVLILFVSIKSINKKNNRYSALIRPLTVIVGCSVHVILCITLHYVEFYTLRNHQHMYYHQQQQMLLRRQQINPHLQQQQQQQNMGGMQHGSFFMGSTIPVEAVMAGMPQLMTPKQPPPPRVLSLICQVIYIFVCLSLGLLYLYLYRILKRILKIKSQNYIHGYQNLSYAIHITIATSLLFILLAILQIFGAVSISAAKPIVTQNPSDINWLKWGYQFSLRLIEIAIITLISWVSGLKTSGGGRNGNMSISLANGEARIANDHIDDSSVFSSAPKISAHDKGDRSQFQQSHHNVAGFFLPCTTSSSSQDQFETDCPTVCNANTNLHTYTMRTGKLIYHDSFGVGSPCGMPPQRKHNYHIQQATYERPYDTNSLHSTAHNTVSDYGGSHVEYHQPDKISSDYNGYMRDDECHYETPKFDHPTVPRSCTVAGGSQRAKLAHKSSIPDSSSTMASLKMLQMSQQQQQQQHAQRKNIMQNDAFQCEPMQDKYNVNMFERPMLPADAAQSSHYSHHVNYPKPSYFVDNMDPKKYHTAAMVRNGGGDYDDSERRSSNSTQSCSSKPPDSGGRYSSYNDIQYNGVRESDTFSNLGESNDVALLQNNTSSSTVSSASCSTKGGGGGGGSSGVHLSGIKLPAFSEKQNHKERSMFCQ